MAQLWTQKRKEDSGSGIKNIDAGELSLKKPTIVFCGGLFNTPQQPKMVRGAIGHMLGMLRAFGERNGDTCEIHAVCYRGWVKNLKHFFNYNSRPNTYSSDEAKQFVDDYLLPHLAKNHRIDDKGKLMAGEKRGVKSVERAFQNLTLMAYSYGTVFAQEVYNAARDRMQDLGYGKLETRYLLSRIHLVSVGCVSKPLREKNRFTSICLMASNDFVSNIKRYVFWSLRETFATATNKALKITEQSRRNLLIAAPVKRRVHEVIEMPNGEKIKKAVEHLLPKWSPLAMHHEIHHYTTDQIDQNSFANIVRFALINCLHRTRALTATEMLKPPKAAADKDQDYKSRIKQAYKPRPRKTPKTLPAK